jgi:hypothetical protein
VFLKRGDSTRRGRDFCEVHQPTLQAFRRRRGEQRRQGAIEKEEETRKVKAAGDTKNKYK